MALTPALIARLHRDGPRAWKAIVAACPDLADGERRALTAFAATLRSVRPRRPAAPAPSRRRPPTLHTKRPPSTGKCRGCAMPLPHDTPEKKRKHFARVQETYNFRRWWFRKLDDAGRHAFMARAWKAYHERAVQRRLAAMDPRFRATLGEAAARQRVEDDIAHEVRRRPRRPSEGGLAKLSTARSPLAGRSAIYR